MKRVFCVALIMALGVGSASVGWAASTPLLLSAGTNQIVNGAQQAADPVCEPLDDGSGCTDVVCPELSQVCVPRVIQRIVPDIAFPPGGQDVLEGTTGHVLIQNLAGEVETYTITGEDPNVTVVNRSDPESSGVFRLVQTEIVEMELWATGPIGHPAIIHLDPNESSLGSVLGLPSAAGDYPADSFFDVFVTIDLPDSGVVGLRAADRIPLSAIGVDALPPLGSTFATPEAWDGVDLLDVENQPSGFRIIEVAHTLPPKRPPWLVIECDCLSENDCHIEYSDTTEPYCTGNCPNNETCEMTVTVLPDAEYYECVCVPLPEPEACCVHDGTCLDLLPDDCAAIRGVSQGPGTVCTQPEACCLGDGACMELDPLCCDDLGGAPQGPNTACVDMTIACCLPDGACVEVDPLCCDDLGGYPSPWGSPYCLGDLNMNGIEDACEDLPPDCEPNLEGTACFPIQCPEVTQVCLPKVIKHDPSDPTSASWRVVECECIDRDYCHINYVDGTLPYCTGDCPPEEICEMTVSDVDDDGIDDLFECVCVPEPRPEACCLEDGTCLDLLPDDCIARRGIPQGLNTLCTQPEACCIDDGVCVEVDPLCCDELGGTRQGPNTACVDMTVACCLAEGECVEVDPLCCDDLGGIPSPWGSEHCLGDWNENGWDDACEDVPPDCEPNLDGTACFNIQCPDPMQICLPKVIRHDLPETEFPPAGEDVLSPTTGVVVIQSPTGGVAAFEITGEEPNLTVVRRSDPEDVGTHRVIDTEIVQMDLSALGPASQPAMIRLAPNERPSVGKVVGADLPGTDFPAESFFDVFVEIDLPDQGVSGLWNREPIPLLAGGLYAIPPLGSSFETPGDWNGVDLLDVENQPTGFRIIQVVHILPPPPSPWEIVECECIDRGYCHVEQALTIEPYCTGDCPNTAEICEMTVTVLPEAEYYECVCMAKEACCLDDGTCVQLTPQDCEDRGGTPQGPGTVCTRVEACCVEDGVCLDLDPLCCDDLGGVRQGPNTACVDYTIACCLPDGGCTEVDPLCCDDLGGVPSPWNAPYCLGDWNQNGVDDACEDLQLIQACCLRDGSCVELTHTDCVLRRGDPQGPGTTCDDRICHPLKWAQPPTFNPDSPSVCFWGWDEPSAYGKAVVADDWACMNDHPITDIHWWGSYVGWREDLPPQNAPIAFHIGIWTDEPASSTLPWSRPREMIWEWRVSRDVLNERAVGCDSVPGTPVDTCFRYDFLIPEDLWFRQGPACEIFWVSISAIQETDPGPYVWGWKTREHFFNDSAVVVQVPNAPQIGNTFEQGYPLGDPPTVRWDMAFVLTTKPAEWIRSNPKPNHSWWRSAHNIARLGFDLDITPPGAGQVMIQELLPGGAFGPDLSGAFSMTVEADSSGNPRTLRIWDNGSTLQHKKWYAVRNIGGWQNVLPFEIHYAVAVGDASDDNRVLAIDAGLVYTGVPTLNAADDERRDINGDGRILAIDAGVVYPNVPFLMGPKPSGH